MSNENEDKGRRPRATPLESVFARTAKRDEDAERLESLRSAVETIREAGKVHRAKVADQQVIGEAIARAVEAAELRNPGAGLGPVKRAEVIREIVNGLPFKGPCAPFLRALAKMVVGVLIEIAVAAFQRGWKAA